MESLLDVEIGRGGFGIVYSHKTDSSLCVKVSNKEKGSISCRQWSNEFKKIQHVMSAIEDMPEYKRLKMVKVLTPTDFTETKGSCFMTLPRIYRPDKDQTKPTLQAQCGWPSSRIIHKGRGEYIGVKEILEIISTDDFKIACRELGVLMGLIHFHAKNDAYDIEVFLGKESKTRKPRFYIADFDQCEPIKNFNEEEIKRMTWSFDAVPYFPRPSCDEEMFEVFKKGYLSVCNHSNPEDMVDKVFDDYD